MKYSILFMGLGIGIWGWFNQAWLAAGILIALILLNPLVGSRWDLNRKQFYRVVDFSFVLVILMLAYGYLSGSDTNPIYSILKWSPVLFAPVVLAQIYSVGSRLPMSALFYAMRGVDNRDHREIDFTLPFAIFAVMAAGAANTQSTDYFMVTVIFVGAVFWFQHPRHFSKITWVLIFAIAIATSHFGHQGLKQLQSYVQAKSIEFIGSWTTNPFKSHTSIGQIGELKLSDQIEFYVVADKPMLLHQSSYDIYYNKVWSASEFVFRPFENTTTAGLDDLESLEIVQQFGNDLILALPDGIATIGELGNSTITRTELDAFKISEPPAWARYSVAYSGVRRSDVSRNDLRIPEQHKHWLSQVSENLALANKPPEQIAASIKNYFLNHFSYTLYTPSQSDADQALTEFMLERRAGHCEYFAMATVLLLRYSGIPARLANGYSVQEYDPDLGMYIVRRRHSHAWAIAKLADSWNAVDTTPPQWLELEAENAGGFQGLSDLFYKLVFYFNQWRVQAEVDGYKLAFGIFLLLLSFYLGWFLYGIKRQHRSARFSELRSETEANRTGMDSELYRVEQYFQEQGQARNESESILNWARRVQGTELEDIALLHYRYRFDPLGLSKAQRQALRSEVKKWFAKIK